MNKINVCLSPALFPFYAEDNSITVMIDAVRASATICTAFENGIKHIVPVSEVETAREYKKSGYIIAGERNGKKIEGFDFGNSPFNFTEDIVKGKTLAFTTTNGTRAVNLVKNDRHKNTNLVIGSFINISALSEYLVKQDKNILVLCSGWKNTVNVEDTLFAGRLAYLLLQKQKYETLEATNLALNIYENSGNDFYDFVMKNSPRLKKKSVYLEKDFRYCLTEDLTSEIPYFDGDKLVSLRKIFSEMQD